MEKYQEIYNYLETFPSQMTVGELIENMDKGEAEFIENQRKQIKEIRDEFVGNSYYYEEADDGKVICKYITYVKELKLSNIKDMLFTCDLITITDTDIHYEESAHVDIKALKMAKKLSRQLFEIAKEKFDNIRSFAI